MTGNGEGELQQLVADRILGQVDWLDSAERITAIQVAAYVFEYVEHWSAEDRKRYQTTAVEMELTADVVNPATGRVSTIFDHGGKVDGMAIDLDTGDELVVEHKSTSDTLGPETLYWRRLAIDSQVSKYLLTLRQNGKHGVSTCLYDVASKPKTKPKAISAADVRRLAETGSYCGWSVPTDTLTAIEAEYEANKGKSGGFTGKIHEADFLDLYGIRLRAAIRADPSSTFGRRRISRTDEELKQYAAELWEVTAEIRKSRRSMVSPKNTGSCLKFGQQCEFFGLCTGKESIEAFEYVSSVHAELDEDHGNGGRDLITNSRVGVFFDCREKHRLRYEVGIVRSNRDRSEALRWGTLFHDLLEVVWGSYRETNS